MSGSVNRDPSRPARTSRDDEREAIGSRMLEQMLEASVGGGPDVGFVEPSDVQALEAVAKKLAGRPFALEPVAFEMVHAMLEVQFTKAGIPADTLRAMAQQIATTLYDDPISRNRLQSLWLGLTQK